MRLAKKITSFALRDAPPCDTESANDSAPRSSVNVIATAGKTSSSGSSRSTLKLATSNRHVRGPRRSRSAALTGNGSSSLCGLERLRLGRARWCAPRLSAGRSVARLRRLGLDRAQLAHRGAARTESLAMVERPAGGLQAARHGAFLHPGTVRTQP